MSLSMRKRSLLVALEATSYNDSTTPATPLQISNLTVSPLEGSEVKRDFIRSYYGDNGSIRVENYMKVDFESEIAGSGTAGTAPTWATLLQACNFMKQTPVVSLASVTTAAIAANISITNTPTATSDTVVFLSTAVAQTLNGLAGSTITVGSESHIAISNTACASGASCTVKVGVPFTALKALGATVTIQPKTVYTPISSVEFETDVATGGKSKSAVFYFYVDGVLHKMRGARGTVSFDISAKKIPTAKWSFTGLVATNSVTDAVDGVAPVGWTTPYAVSTANTTDISISGFNAGFIDALTIDVGNEVKYRQLIGVGAESVLITNRTCKASVSLEATKTAGNTAAYRNWFDDARLSTSGITTLSHGAVFGNNINFIMPSTQPANPKYSDSDGIAMIGLDLYVKPVLGDDELKIVFN